MNRVSKGILIATAAATLFASGAVKARAEDKGGGDDKVKCTGINECKGKGACAGAGGSCAGQNACKGKGMVVVPKAECEQKHGKIIS
jgi:uncharacterized membrane protein